MWKLKNVMSFKEKLINDKSFAALNISERFGIDLKVKDLKKYAVTESYIFFQCDENILYEWEDDKPVQTIFAIYLDSFIGEIVTDYNLDGFNWSQNSLIEESKALDKIGT